MPLVHCIALILVISLGAPITERTAAWHAYTMWGGPDSILSTSESLPEALGGIVTQSLIQALSWLNASYLQCLNTLRTELPGGNGLRDSSLSCCAGGTGSIPAIGIVKVQYSGDFSPSPVKGGR